MIALLCAGSAQASGAPIPHGTVELISENQSIAIGHPFYLGLHFQLEKGWHIYWVNPGDSGEPPRVTWQLSDRSQRRSDRVAYATAHKDIQRCGFRLSGRGDADRACACRDQLGGAAVSTPWRRNKSVGLPRNVYPR